MILISTYHTHLYYTFIFNIYIIHFFCLLTDQKGTGWFYQVQMCTWLILAHKNLQHKG